MTKLRIALAASTSFNRSGKLVFIFNVESNSCLYFTQSLHIKTRATLLMQPMRSVKPKWNITLSRGHFRPLGVHNMQYYCFQLLLTRYAVCIYCSSQQYALRPSQYEAFVDDKDEWISDKFFTQQRLAGVNPMSLRRVTNDCDGKWCIKNKYSRVCAVLIVGLFRLHSTNNEPFRIQTYFD